MYKRKLRSIGRLTSLIRIVKMDKIKPFKEKPSLEKELSEEDFKKDNLPATDLFSLFTANIIKEEVIFTR